MHSASHPFHPATKAVVTVVTGLLLVAALAGAVPTASAASTDGGVAWTVNTVDNEHGENRPNFVFDVDPGDVIVDAMVVTNTGTVPLPLEVYAADAFTTANGNLDILPGGTPSIGAGAWVTPALTALTLAPGERAEVAFTITVPADATPGDHSAGLVTSFISGDSTQALEVDRRLGTRINLRVAGELAPATDVAIVSTEAIPSLNPFAPSTLRLTYRVENVGNTRVTGSEAIAAHTIAGLLGTTQIEPELPEILPRSTIEVEREIPVTSLGWIGGTLTVAPEGVGLGAGSMPPVTVDFGTVAIPWSLLVVLVVVAGITVGVLLWVRRHGRSGSSSPMSARTPEA